MLLLHGEFCDAYPDANFLLNQRDLESWIEFSTESMFKVLRWRLLSDTYPSAAAIMLPHCNSIWKVFLENDTDNKEKCKETRSPT